MYERTHAGRRAGFVAAAHGSKPASDVSPHRRPRAKASIRPSKLGAAIVSTTLHPTIAADLAAIALRTATAPRRGDRLALAC